MMHPALASIDPFSTSAVTLAPTVEPAATEPLEPPSMAQVAAEQIPEPAPPEGYVLISQADIERMMDLVAECVEWQEDYLRLREKERIELPTPPPAFLRNPDFERARERAA